MTLVLALKIYKLKYGKYPDSIDALVPEIIPTAPPLNPYLGQKYEYAKNDNGFTILVRIGGGCYDIEVNSKE